jgi:sulfur carrier protein ThiS
MEKANKGTGDTIAIAVTRLGSDPVPVTLAPKSTVKDALAKAGITTTGRAEYFVDGQRAELNDILEDGDVLAIVTPKQAGA